MLYNAVGVAVVLICGLLMDIISGLTWGPFPRTKKVTAWLCMFGAVLLLLLLLLAAGFVLWRLLR